MQIDLTMRATYFGPLKDMVEYKAEEATVSDTVQWTKDYDSPFVSLTNQVIKDNAQVFMGQVAAGELLSQQALAELFEGLPEEYQALLGPSVASLGVNGQLADHAYKTISDHPATYDAGDRANLWTHADCSSWIWGVFVTFPGLNAAEIMKWKPTSFDNRRQGPIDTNGMLALMRQDGGSPKQEVFFSRDTSTAKRQGIIEPLVGALAKGDLIFRKAGVVSGHDKGHVALIYAVDVATRKVEYVHIGSPGKPASKTTASFADIAKGYTEAYRPQLASADVPGNRLGGD
jgi:hypothetical protein